jgi:predicted Zn-dependent protease
MSKHFLLLLILLFLISPQNASAQAAQVQPILGFAWPTHNIPVSVQTAQSNATLAVLKAIRTWNLAQQWFITTYMANQGTPLVLYQTNSTFDSMITVSFNQTQTSDDLGWTSTHEFHDQQGAFRKVIVNISIDLTHQNGKPLSSSELQTLATHELGHALGLDHTTFSKVDLLNHTPAFMFPSTLNLYAVYQLSKATSISSLPKQPVTLPANIPYRIVSQAELNAVTPPVVQNSATSSWSSQFLSVIINAVSPYFGIGIAFVGVIVALALAGVVMALMVRDQRQTQGTPTLRELS